MRPIIVGIISGLVAGFVVAAWGSPQIAQEAAVEAYKQGRVDALKTRLNGNLNWELEQTCVSMWASKQ